MNKTSFCIHCNKKIINFISNHRKFCSRECFDNFRNKKISFICIICGKEIIGYNKRPRKYCSQNCYRKRKKKIVVNICKICKKPYRIIFNQSSKRKFCSHKCYYVHRSKTYIRDKHPQWIGGKIIRNRYIHIRNDKHPFNINGYVPEHRLIVEKYLNRYLTANEIVHHINFNPMNNNPENLFVFENIGQHKIFHSLLKNNSFLKNFLKSNIIPTVN